MSHPIQHVLYTNAPGRDGVDYRPVLVPEAPVDSWREVTAWLTKLAGTGHTGLASRSFAIGNQSYTAIAFSNPTFAHENIDRGKALLVHAVLLPLDDRQECGDVGAALVSTLRTFEQLAHRRIARPSIDNYRKICGDIVMIDVLSIEPRSFAELDAVFVERIWAAPFGAGGHDAAEFDEPSADFPERISAAIAVLPLPLRLGVRWETIAGARARVLLMHALPAQATVPVRAACAQRARALVQDGLADRLRALSERWDIRTWNEFHSSLEGARQAVQAYDADLVHSENSDDEQTRSSMVKDMRGRTPPAGDELNQRLDADREAVEQGARRYVDERFSALTDGLRDLLTRPATQERNVSAWVWWGRVFFVAHLVVTLPLACWLLYALHRDVARLANTLAPTPSAGVRPPTTPPDGYNSTTTQPPPITTTPVTTPPPTTPPREPNGCADTAVEKAPTQLAKAVNGDPLTTWRCFLQRESSKAAAHFRAIAGKEVTAQDARARLEECAQRLSDRREPLSDHAAGTWGACALYVFEYVDLYTREAPHARVDGDVTDIDAARVKKLLAARALQGPFKQEFGERPLPASTPAVQIAVAIRWISAMTLP